MSAVCGNISAEIYGKSAYIFPLNAEKLRKVAEKLWKVAEKLWKPLECPQSAEKISRKSTEMCGHFSAYCGKTAERKNLATFLSILLWKMRT